jgi:predicted ATP-grasp superfamily ATP-dependent carboligase
MESDTSHKPAIILGCHKLGLGIIRALGEKKIPVIGVYYNNNDMGFVSKYVVQSYKCPDPQRDEEGFKDILLQIGSQLPGGVLIPSDDPTLLATSRHKSRLQQFYKVACADWSIIEKILVKKNTYRIADEAGVPAPKTIIPRTLDEARKFATDIGFPCLLKPSIAHEFFSLFKKKMITITNEGELETAFELGTEANTEMMLQELIPGDDTHGFNYNSYFLNGEPMVEFTAQKCRLSPPGTGFPRVIVSRFLPELIEYGRRMVRAVGFNGYSCVEFKRDVRDGIHKLMEINGRQNLSTSLAVKCGINFPYLTYMYEMYGFLPSSRAKYTEGVYWIDLENDLVETLRSFRLEKYSLSSYLLPYLKPKVFCVASLTDPKPIMKRSIDTVKLGLRKLDAGTGRIFKQTR